VTVATPRDHGGHTVVVSSIHGGPGAPPAVDQGHLTANWLSAFEVLIIGYVDATGSPHGAPRSSLEYSVKKVGRTTPQERWAMVHLQLPDEEVRSAIGQRASITKCRGRNPLPAYHVRDGGKRPGEKHQGRHGKANSRGGLGFIPFLCGQRGHEGAHCALAFGVNARGERPVGFVVRLAAMLIDVPRAHRHPLSRLVNDCRKVFHWNIHCSFSFLGA
jgi:hypothetical protein